MLFDYEKTLAALIMASAYVDKKTLFSLSLLNHDIRKFAFSKVPVLKFDLESNEKPTLIDEEKLKFIIRELSIRKNLNVLQGNSIFLPFMLVLNFLNPKGDSFWNDQIEEKKLCASLSLDSEKQNLQSLFNLLLQEQIPFTLIISFELLTKLVEILTPDLLIKLKLCLKLFSEPAEESSQIENFKKFENLFIHSLQMLYIDFKDSSLPQKSLSFSYLAKFSALEILMLANCSIQEIKFPPNTKDVSFVSCNFTDFDFVTSHSKSINSVQELSIAECKFSNQILNLDHFSNATSIYVSTASSSVTPITISCSQPLSQLKKLALSCYNTENLNWKNFSTLNTLSFNYCSRLKFEDLEPLKNLKVLHIDNSRFLHIPIYVAGLAKLDLSLESLNINEKDWTKEYLDAKEKQSQPAQALLFAQTDSSAEMGLENNLANLALGNN